MVLPIIPIATFLIGIAPTIYYGVTQGEWLYGWDYVLTGHDYVGEFVDGILPDDDYDDYYESGLTDGDYGFFMEMFAGLEELITIGIVISLLAIIVFALFRRT